jgi:hypothetical protein
MGTWGAGLFENDDAADLRSEYRAFLADAQSDAGATIWSRATTRPLSIARRTRRRSGWRWPRSNGGSGVWTRG